MSAPGWIAVALLGSLAALARFLLDRAVSARSSSGLPFGTFAVNISGAFVLGLLNGLALSGEALVLSGSATIGSYTTFSTWMLETHRLSEDGQLAAAATNVVASIVAGVCAAALGRWLGGLL